MDTQFTWIGCFEMSLSSQEMVFRLKLLCIFYVCGVTNDHKTELLNVKYQKENIPRKIIK